MLDTNVARPGYAENFHCIGSMCEESCCTGFQVDIDVATFDKYRTLPPSPLRALIDDKIVGPTEHTRKIKPSADAWVKLLPSNQCPFHNEEHLCQIQLELGENYLSTACANYPRSSVVINNLVDMTLTLSCPEACRLILLNPNLLESGGAAVERMSWDESNNDPTLVSYFWPIREFVIGLIRNRTYPLWQRMFLLGIFSKRLEAIRRGEIKGGFPSMLKGFSAAVALGSLRSSIETLPADLNLQLGMVLELVKLRYSKARRSHRFIECINHFSMGIGYSPEATLENMSAQYGTAYKHYFEPFFAKHPYILENYLINAIFRKLFPFGLHMGERRFDRSVTFGPAKEFALLATDFALIKGLLIGVAGAHKEVFSTEHVVQTVQSVSKYFEHNSEFVTKAHQILVDNHLDNANGLTLLLRN